MDAVSQREADLVSRYIEPNHSRPGVEDARLAEYGVPVWALVGHYTLSGRTPRRSPMTTSCRRMAVEAALAYYRRHKAVIDARIAANLA
jgi:hypothetical protein